MAATSNPLSSGLQFKGMSLFCQGQLESARRYLEDALVYKNRAEEVGSDFPSMSMIYLSWTMISLDIIVRHLNSSGSGVYRSEAGSLQIGRLSGKWMRAFRFSR